MPESMYKLNRKRAREIIRKSVHHSHPPGVPPPVENDGAVDVLYLNEEFFSTGAELV